VDEALDLLLAERNPKCRPFFDATSKRSLGTSSPSQSRAWVVK